MNTYEQRRRLKTRRETHELKRDSILDLMGVYAPMAAPLVPAGLMAASIVKIFPELLGIGFWPSVAIAAVVVVVTEVLALISTETYLEMRAHNQAYGESEHAAPSFYAGFIVALYCILVLTLVVFLKMFPALAMWSLIPLSMMGVLTSWIVMLRKGFEDTKLTLAEIAEKDQAERDQLAEVQRLNSALASAESNNERLTTELADLRNQMALMQKNSANSPSLVTLNPSLAADKSAQKRKVSKAERQRRLTEWLLTHYAGSSMEDVPRNSIMDEFGIGRDTALADIRQVWKGENWNGSVPAAA